MKTQISQQSMRGSMLFSCTIPILGCAHVGIQKQNGDTMNSYNAQHVSFPRDALPRHNSNGSPRRIKSCDCREDSDRGVTWGRRMARDYSNAPTRNPNGAQVKIYSQALRCEFDQMYSNAAMWKSIPTLQP